LAVFTQVIVTEDSQHKGMPAACVLFF